LRSSKWIGLVLTTIPLLSINIVGVKAQSQGLDLGGLVTSLFTNPASLLIFLIQLSLGIGLGYISFKALKYLLALAAIIILGMILNVWQAPQLGIDFMAIYSQIVKFAYTFGLTTMLPLTIGFVIGALIGTLK